MKRAGAAAFFVGGARGRKEEKDMEEGTGKGCGGMIPPDFWVWTAAMAAMLWVLGMSLSGCSRTVYVPVETVRADTTYLSRGRADSVYVQDSVAVTLDLRRDTVVRTEYRFRTHWRERVRTDTVWRTRRDSVSVPCPVERELTRWERMQMALGSGTMGFLAVAFAVWLWRRFRK